VAGRLFLFLLGISWFRCILLVMYSISCIISVLVVDILSASLYIIR
jgi:hypothetical protein